MTTAKQLSLFKGKRQRGRAPPAPLEFGVHCAIADTLRRWIMPGWIWFHYPSGGERPKKVNAKTGKLYSPAADRLKRMGAREGVSDFILIGPPHGTVHAYELKRQGHKATEEQLAFGYDVITAGGCFTWGDSYDHAIEVFQAWGALPKTIKVQ